MPSEIETIIDLFTRVDFVAGLGIGLLALVILQIVPTGLRDWGLASSVAALLVINLTVERRISMSIGVLLLAAGGAWLERARGQEDDAVRNFPWLLLVVGAFVVSTRGGLEGPPWLQLVTPVFILVSGHLMSRWTGSNKEHMVGPLFAIAVIGLWLTIPDTDNARVLLGVSLITSLATLRPFGARAALSGSYATAALFAWIAATGGATREASIVGGWACLGLLILLPILGVDRPGFSKRALVIIHIVTVAMASRLIGMWESAMVATVAVAIVAFVLYVAIRVMAPTPDHGPR